MSCLDPRSHAPCSLTLTSLGVLFTLALATPSPVAAQFGCFSIGRSHGNGGGAEFGYSTSSPGEGHWFQYALIERGGNTSCAADGNHMRTIGWLQDEARRTGREVLWFSMDDREYVIHDQATIERAHEIVEPMSRLGAEQGRLGSRQGEIGRRQGELGSLQGQMGHLQAQLASLRARGDSRYRAELGELRQQLAELSAQVRLLGERQRELGAQQWVLGQRQRELGEQQRRASLLAFDQLRSLADKSIASGTAKAFDSDQSPGW